MKQTSPKIVIIPHYIGEEQYTKLFKRIFTDEIQRKLRLRDNEKKDKNDK